MVEKGRKKLAGKEVLWHLVEYANGMSMVEMTEYRASGPPVVRARFSLLALASANFTACSLDQEGTIRQWWNFIFFFKKKKITSFYEFERFFSEILAELSVLGHLSYSAIWSFSQFFSAFSIFSISGMER
jgi:hypothetical protein